MIVLTISGGNMVYATSTIAATNSVSTTIAATSRKGQESSSATINCEGSDINQKSLERRLKPESKPGYNFALASHTW